MKKIITLLFILILCIFLAACTGNQGKDASAPASSTPVVVQETPDQSIAPQSPTPSPSRSSVPQITPEPLETSGHPGASSSTKSVDPGSESVEPSKNASASPEDKETSPAGSENTASPSEFDLVA